jgi:signal transduction histidine kinase
MNDEDKTREQLLKEIGELRRLAESERSEAEAMSLELAINLSEVFEALKKIASGDPLVRIDEASGIELIARLRHMINLTAAEIGEIVNECHEFAIGLTEHFDVLHRVSKGDLTARVSGKSEVEILEYLKKLTNEMVAGILREITEREKAEEALHKAYAEMEQKVLESTAGLRAINEALQKEINERRQAEEALVEQQRFSASLIENSAIATFVLDKSHRITIWNKACEQLTACSAHEMIGTYDQWKPFYNYKRPTVADVILDNNIDSLPLLYTTYSRSALNPQGIRAEGWYKSLGAKERYIIFEASPILNSRGDMIAAIETLQDITQSKRLEEQLLHAQKIEAVGQLAGGVAHDFNNILSALMGYIHLAKMHMKEDDASRVYIDQMLDTTKRAANLTHSLLAFSRKQIMNPRPVNLNEIMKDLQKLLFRVIGDDIELTTVLTAGDPMVMADPGQIDQVLVNLATNARDAMPGGGRLSMETDIVEIDEEYIKTHGYGKAGRYALISISDTGAGMDEKTEARIFEPFFTTKEVGKGTGLGLAMVYGIVKQHEGYINVYSEPGKGTTFKIYLPLIETETGGEKKYDRHAPAGGTETILLAEDNEEVRAATKELIEKFGYTVIVAKDGEDAVNKFGADADRIRLLLLDVIMPRKNGKETYDEIRRLKPDIKVLFLSGYAADILDKKGVIDEGLECILKPVSPDKLLNKIREILDKE